MFLCPPMDRAFPYSLRMDQSKASRLLAENLNRLMASRMDLDSNPKLSKRSGVPVSTLSRLRNANVEATLQVVERLAAAFGVEPSRLISGAPSWPFSRVALARVTALNAADLAYVEGRLEAAIERCENPHPPTPEDHGVFNASQPTDAKSHSKVPKRG